MIQERLYQAELLNGKKSQLFETRQEALRAHRGNISKLIEVIPEAKVKHVVTDEALFISQRSNDDLEISINCGYAVMYNCPSRSKIYEGMKYLEVSEDQVLEGEILRLERYERSIHTAWSIIEPKNPEKEWGYVIYHKNAKILPREEVEKKYDNPLKGTQGGISYINLRR